MEDKEGDQWQVTDQEINLSDNREDENKGVYMSADAGVQGRGGAQPPDPMTAITNAVKSDPASLIFICLGFEVVAVH